MLHRVATRAALIGDRTVVLMMRIEHHVVLRDVAGHGRRVVLLPVIRCKLVLVLQEAIRVRLEHR